MPLPPALLERLKKRGIVKAPNIEPSDPEEEIIAEDYDDDVTEVGALTPAAKTPNKSGGAPGCPNKTNPYHKCTLFCWERWGGGISMDRLDADMEKKRKRMLRKYPLPSGWEEVFSPEHGRYYYWNTASDEVCWLSPTHPKSVVTLPASRMATVPTDPAAAKRRRMRSPSPPSRRPRFADDEVDEEEVEEPTPDEDEERAAQQSKAKGDKGSKKRPDFRKPFGKRKAASDSDPLDPMDPAAYSEVPRGKWSAGLEQGDDAKTGVDSTASGPLFQMRPYPAPGAILKRNAESKKKK